MVLRYFFNCNRLSYTAKIIRCSRFDESLRGRVEYNKREREQRVTKTWCKKETSMTGQLCVLRSSGTVLSMLMSRRRFEVMMMVMMMTRSPLRKLRHYELRATHSQRYGVKHCGRGAGTIESRGCNTFHGGINARGAIWIHPGRDRETPVLYALRHISNQWSRVLHRAQLSAASFSLQSPILPPPPSREQCQESEKLAARFDRRFIDYTDRELGEMRTV